MGQVGIYSAGSSRNWNDRRCRFKIHPNFAELKILRDCNAKSRRNHHGSPVVGYPVFLNFPPRIRTSNPEFSSRGSRDSAEKTCAPRQNSQFATDKPGTEEQGSEEKHSQNLHDGNRIIVKDSRHVFAGELVRGVGDEKTGLSDSTVTDDHTPEIEHIISTRELANNPSTVAVICSRERVRERENDVPSIAIRTSNSSPPARPPPPIPSRNRSG